MIRKLYYKLQESQPNNKENDGQQQTENNPSGGIPERPAPMTPKIPDPGSVRSSDPKKEERKK